MRGRGPISSLWRVQLVGPSPNVVLLPLGGLFLFVGSSIYSSSAALPLFTSTNASSGSLLLSTPPKNALMLLASTGSF
jgi:hypothetical protein